MQRRPERTREKLLKQHVTDRREGGKYEFLPFSLRLREDAACLIHESKTERARVQCFLCSRGQKSDTFHFFHISGVNKNCLTIRTLKLETFKVPQETCQGRSGFSLEQTDPDMVQPFVSVGLTQNDRCETGHRQMNRCRTTGQFSQRLLESWTGRERERERERVLTNRAGWNEARL